jgi:hypothetical protein
MKENKEAYEATKNAFFAWETLALGRNEVSPPDWVLEYFYEAADAILDARDATNNKDKELLLIAKALGFGGSAIPSFFVAGHLQP